MRVTDDQLTEVRERGFVLVEGFVPVDLLREARAALWDIYPRPEEYFANPEDHVRYTRHQFAGLRLFPYPSWALNRLAVLPDLVDAAERLCGSDDLDLYKVELWAKYAGAIDYDQPHHRDYGNHSLVVPREGGNPVQMTTFMLLSDVDENDGPTCLVPREYGRDVPLVPRELEPGALEEVEVKATGPAGSLLIYTTDVLHRGSDFGEPGRSRFALLADFQRRGLPFTGKMAWPSRALEEPWGEAMARMKPRERMLFGFPAPGDPYWNDQTLRDVALRYPSMDMAPYRAARVRR